MMEIKVTNLKKELPLDREPRFYSFSQNNSGGHFRINDDVGHLVVIEARSIKEVTNRAEELLDNSDSCDCCGDRWSFSFYGDEEKEGKSFPCTAYGDKNVFELVESDLGYCDEEYVIHVYYLNGDHKKIVYIK